MVLAKLYSKFRLRYQDSEQEKEYQLLKLPLLKQFFICLFVCITVYYIPVTARYLQKDLFPQSYIAIGLLVLGIILFFLRFKLTKCLEWISLLYVIVIIAVGIYNIRHIIPRSSYEFFYMGYSLALVHRLVDYRIVKFRTALGFTILFTILKFTLIEMTDVILGMCIVFLETFPLVLTYIVEKGDRNLFATLYQSKQQLLKFKTFLTDYLPNQMAIFSSNYSSYHFINDSFKNAFKHENISQLKNYLQKFVMVEEDVEKNRFLLSYLGGKNLLNSPLGLSDILDLLANQTKLMTNFTGMSFQAIETNTAQDRSRSSQNPSPNAVNQEKAQEDSAISSLRKRLTKKEKTKKTNKERSGEHLLQSEKHDSQGDNLVHEEENNEAFDSDSQSSPDSPRKRVLKVRIFPIIWDTQDAIAVLIDDVTHERTIMELKIADKNKDLVIATISHELRTPLNGMLGLINIVEKRLKQSDVFPYLEACKHSSLLLLSLVNSMLDLSQIRKNKLKLNYSQVSLQSLLDETKALFSSFCISKNLSLKIDIASNIPDLFVTDPGRLNQVLVNLIGNAFKFTFKGGITVKARLESQKPFMLRLSVEDTGIGIKEDDQEKLFKMFGRIEHKDKTLNTHGVGLGLSISYSLAEILNPTEKRGIEVRSEYGKGSIFSFFVEDLKRDEKVIDEMPENFGEEDSTVIDENTGHLKITDKIASYTDNKDKSGFLKTHIERERKTERTRTESTKEKPWCLIVDDNPFNLMVANHIMEERGYAVENAMNGKEAILKFQLHHNSGKTFQLVLMDCQMPIMDGYEATKRLKGMMKAGQISDCPIIALTANTRNEKHERLYEEVGMNGYVAKPLQIRELDEVLKDVQKKRKKKRDQINLENGEE